MTARVVPRRDAATGFDLSDDDWLAAIPPAGIHEVEVVNATIHPKPDTAWLKIVYRAVAGAELHEVEELLALDAPKGSARYARTAEGKNRLRAILAANGIPWQRVRRVEDVPALLLGCRVHLAVSHRRKGGDLPVPHVEGVVEPPRGAGEAPDEAGTAAAPGVTVLPYKPRAEG